MTLDQPPPEDPRPAPENLHVAVIMDGNGRWAANRGWPRLVGHRKGVERVRQLVEACPDLGIRYLTLYAFSTENWKRSTEEVLGLMSLLSRFIKAEAKRLKKEGVRLRFIGDRTRLEPKLQRLMGWIEAQTASNARLFLTVAVNYGGRDEITRAMRQVAQRVSRGEIAPEAVTDAVVTEHLDTAFLPDPDLVVRSSGETRVSNFLLWQAAYSEYIFTPVLWPDFTPETMRGIIGAFLQRERRFGGVKP